MNTGCTLRFDKTHLKEVIVMWLDMQSFWWFDTFEPKISFLFSLRKANHVLRFDNLTKFFVRRFGDLTKSDRFWLEFVKSSKRQAKNSSRESFWFVVLKIWQIRAKIGPNLSNLQNVEQKTLSNYQNEARDWLFEEKIRMRFLVRNCQIIKTIAYQATWR